MTKIKPRSIITLGFIAAGFIMHLTPTIGEAALFIPTISSLTTLCVTTSDPTKTEPQGTAQLAFQTSTPHPGHVTSHNESRMDKG